MTNEEYLNSSVTVLKGIGNKKAELFRKIGVESIRDLLYTFPRNYEDRRKICDIADCKLGEMCCIMVRPVRQVAERRLKQKLSLFLLNASDNSGYITVKWFSAPFCKPALKPSDTLVVYGKLISSAGKKEFEMHYMEKLQEQKYTGVIVPVYHATSGLSSKTIAETVRMAFSNLNEIEEPLPDEIIRKFKYPDVYNALFQLHFPDDFNKIAKARSRFAFEELFVMQLALFMLKDRRNDKTSHIIDSVKYIREYADSLPFKLTIDQKSTINEICADLKSGKPMNRLVQGDVGSGKTAVAAATAYATAKNGYQTVFMAPTEILAFQHFNTLKELLPEEVRVCAVTSSVKNKKELYAKILNGDYDIIVGTHAVIEDGVRFKNLALCITDEQHRFGVNQRAALSAKGENPHILVMSATPIPRTLSLILYGDLDVSVIKTLPSGRQPVETIHVGTDKLSRVYGFVRKQAELGFQSYVVCPLVEESESIEAVSVDEKLGELSRGELNGLRVLGLHGKMKPSEKENVMNEFKNGNVDVLVSTTVIEVGVDVPNATLMVIENAERFGLSQLHQLRGRVGRGKEKSYCILISDTSGETGIKRMEIMTSSNDGFVISQKDLELRGCGQFFGTRQHGLPELKVANLFSDIEILKEAQNVAFQVLSDDPGLKSDEMAHIRKRIENLFSSLDGNDIFN